MNTTSNIDNETKKSEEENQATLTNDPPQLLEKNNNSLSPPPPPTTTAEHDNNDNNNNENNPSQEKMNDVSDELIIIEPDVEDPNANELQDSNRTSTILDLSRSLIILLRIVLSGSEEERAFFEERENFIKTKCSSFAIIELSPYANYSVDNTGMKNFSWTHGRFRLNFEVEDQADKTAWFTLLPHLHIVGVIGLLHGPSIGKQNLTFQTIFEKFLFDCNNHYHENTYVVKCAAFDLPDEQLVDENLPNMLQQGLEVFPPSKKILDDGRLACDFHMSHLIMSISSALIEQYDLGVKQCDQVFDLVNSALKSATPTTQLISTLFLSGNSAKNKSDVQLIALPEDVKHITRLVSGASSHPGDVLNVNLRKLTTLNPKNLKSVLGRLCAYAGKLCLIAGSPVDALQRLEKAAAYLKVRNDLIWEASVREAQASACFLVYLDKWSSSEIDEEKEEFIFSYKQVKATVENDFQTLQELDFSEGKRMVNISLEERMEITIKYWREKIQKHLDSALDILKKALPLSSTTANPLLLNSLRKLHSEISLRAAMTYGDGTSMLDFEWFRVYETLNETKKLQVSTSAWLGDYLKREALLWREFNVLRMEMFCLFECFLLLAATHDFVNGEKIGEKVIVLLGGSVIASSATTGVAINKEEEEDPRCLRVRLLAAFLRKYISLLRSAIKSIPAERQNEEFGAATKQKYVYYGVQYLSLLSTTTLPIDEEVMGNLALFSNKNFVLFAEMNFNFTPISPRDLKFYLLFPSPPRAKALKKNKGEREINIFMTTAKEHKEETLPVLWVKNERALVEFVLTVSPPLHAALRKTGVQVMIKNQPESKKTVNLVNAQTQVQLSCLVNGNDLVENKQLDLIVFLFGCSFSYRIPPTEIPPIIDALPLLQRKLGEVETVWNVGAARAVFEYDRTVVRLSPNEAIKNVPLNSNLVYWNEEETYERELLSSEPHVVATRLVRANTEDFIKEQHPIVASMVITARVLRREEEVVYVDNVGSGEKVETSEMVTLKNQNLMELSFKINLNQSCLIVESNEDNASIIEKEILPKFRINKQPLFLSKRVQTSFSSSYPPDWVLTCKREFKFVGKVQENVLVNVFQFSELKASFHTALDEAVVKEYSSCFLVFSKNKQDGKNKYVELASDDPALIWHGSSPLLEALRPVHFIHLAFSQKGDYVVCWCVQNKRLRVRFVLNKLAVNV